MTYRYQRSAFQLPTVQLQHMTIQLSFSETHVTGAALLVMTARQALDEVVLDARALEIFEVSLAWGDGTRELPLPGDEPFTACPYRVDETHHKLVISLPRRMNANETVRVLTRCRCVPSDALLEGIYRDVTPSGAPQQYISQCQQWGFQRILPVIDDCTAKCTFRTTLEGDSRYTHLISNGDVDRQTNPDGCALPIPGQPKRKRITFVNNVPMAPYLFFVGAGTWDEVTDEVIYPEGQRITLSYLVPPGKSAGARLPLAILKRAILWQHARLGYCYPFDTYRTICMEKSNYGGMENVGNTTIITEAALIDETTTDDRIIYAHGVIVHEYEHNHCGSGVTMTSPFDMWLNEAYTVDIEKQFTESVFDPAFMRLREMDAIRAPGNGPLAMEEAGNFGRIVREGFNDPDEVVDGVTYVKAPEVLNMLRQLMGPQQYEAAARTYFARYEGSHADTAAFLACFREQAGSWFDVFTREWLFSSGYPQITVEHAYDVATRTWRMSLTQTRTGHGGLFTLPFAYTAVDATGRDMPEISGMLCLSSERHEKVVKDVAPPAFLSFNRNAGFYGTCEDLSVTPELLSQQTVLDSHAVNRVEAMRQLTDLERRSLLDDASAPVSARWREVYQTLFEARDTPDAIRGYLLKIDEQPWDRRLLPWVRERGAIRRKLLQAALDACGEENVIAALYASRQQVGELSEQVLSRFLRNAWLQLLTVSDTTQAQRALESTLTQALNMTDRLNTLTALWQSNHPQRRVILAREGNVLRQTLNGYLGYLQVIGKAPRDEVFDVLAEEQAREGFSCQHPGLSRALYVPLSLNNSLIWQPRGMQWLTETAVTMAHVSEYNTLRLIAPCQACHTFAPDLREAVHQALREMLVQIDATTCPSVTGRIKAYLNK